MTGAPKGFGEEKKKKSHPHASEAILRGEPCCRFIIYNSSELMQYSHDN